MRAELTQQEARVVDLLAQAWNEYLQLPVEHSVEAPEFCVAIHRCQDMVLARCGRRALNRRRGD
ncbi:TPA: hypothetical protein ACRNH0_003336 [Pseudomonas aeruginosa]|uniref:hypothetical protein n=1 Tax=Pseudomonas aeruginosa TaxID=287 RepID=UPI00071786FE|nr:hypothetical protein [Pseudomonas aeruginosa]EJA2567274.1 hypothetical protein [Pseudomonas aeruginosa]EKV6970430.1 hypothetical protein [Pseudomonas aeruginosa]EKW2848225.1 hypothetical protein [Pseudomonas aeruginosa]KAA8771430.1 hypothetical protein F3155_33165 [Pseudomonas aeruginosa]KRV27025.1 hypothetical protein AN461_27475 [Pseudomonas aeruginosa]